MTRFSVLVAVLASLLLAPSAMAAMRVADPAGTGTACTDAAPCAIDTAINSAGSGDEVILNPGDYGTVSSPLSTDLTASVPNLTIHGRAGAARPSIVSNTVGALRLFGSGDVVRDVIVRSEYATNGIALLLSGSVIAERVEVRADGSGSVACTLLGTALIMDATCLDTGSGGTGLDVNSTLSGPNNATARNVTAVVTGAAGSEFFGNGVRVFSTSGRSGTLTATNVIAQGTNHDVQVNKDTDPATVRLDHVDAADISLTGGATSVDLGGNITAPPAFVNASAFDFHELASSPTVDAGRDDALNGPFAFDFVVRALGAHTDIGAAELLPPPPVTTGPAGAITTNAAQLSGSVTPNGAVTAAHFEWGPTAAYGQTTPDTALGAFTTPQPVTAPLTGLLPGTTYHYRLVATNAGGTSTGEDATFTTQAAPLAVPALSKVSQLRRVWRVDRRHPTASVARKAKRGTRFSYTLSVDATVRFAVQQLRPHRAPRTVMRLRRAGHGGANRTAFSGVVGKKALKPGRYRVRISATNAAGTSATKTLTFRVTRG